MSFMKKVDQMSIKQGIVLCILFKQQIKLGIVMEMREK